MNFNDENGILFKVNKWWSKPHKIKINAMKMNKSNKFVQKKKEHYLCVKIMIKFTILIFYMKNLI